MPTLHGHRPTPRGWLMEPIATSDFASRPMASSLQGRPTRLRHQAVLIQLMPHNSVVFRNPESLDLNPNSGKSPNYSQLFGKWFVSSPAFW